MVEKIGYGRPVAASARAEAKRRASGVSGASFSALLDAASGVEAADTVTAPLPVVGTGALLGLQEVSEEEIQRRKAFKRGKTALDTLEQLRDGLLAGGIHAATIRSLEQTVAEQRAVSDDPRLNAILDEIELRAAVELAKLERATQGG